MLPQPLAPPTTAVLSQVPEVTDDELLERFLARFSPHTRRAYDGDLRRFAAHCGSASPLLAVADLLGGSRGRANRIAMAWRSAMEARGLAAATVGRRLAALRSVVALAGRLGRCDWELSVDSPKVVPYRDTRGPGRDGWRAIAGRLASGQDRTAVRDLALCRVLHDLMLRRSEVAGLDLTDLEFEGGKPTSVWILGKGKSAKIRLRAPGPDFGRARDVACRARCRWWGGLPPIGSLHRATISADLGAFRLADRRAHRTPGRRRSARRTARSAARGDYLRHSARSVAPRGANHRAACRPADDAQVHRRGERPAETSRGAERGGLTDGVRPDFHPRDRR